MIYSDCEKNQSWSIRIIDAIVFLPLVFAVD